MKLLLLTLLVNSIAATAFAVPNPAAENCVENGGVHEVLDSDAGQFGACRVGKGLIGSWTLFKEMNGAKSIAVEIFFNKKDLTLPEYLNPAANYCSQVGGNIKIYESEAGETGFCEFKDGSTINQWTLFRGAQEAEELAELVR